MRNNKNILLKVAIIFSILLIGFTFMAAKLVYLSFQEPVDIYDISFNISEHGTGGHIETTLDYVLDNCAYMTTTNTTNGVETSSSTDYYYIIPINGKDDDDYYICVEVDEDESSLYDTLVDNTWEYIESGDYTCFDTYADFAGTLDDLDDEIYGYMVEWFEEAEVYETDAELKEHVLPIVLKPMHYDSATAYIIIFLVLLALTILFWALFFIKRSKNKANEAQAQAQFQAQFPGQEYGQYVVINGVSYPKSSMAHINAYVEHHENVVAIKELREMTGLSLEESKNVIDNWFMYYK